MGGETLLTDRLEDLVDTMIEHKRFEICFSFVTNGTVFRLELLNKLKLQSQKSLSMEFIMLKLLQMMNILIWSLHLVKKIITPIVV